MLGIDETRARTVRWVLADAGWRRTDPWLTSFVDADPTRQGPLLGLAPGRSGACVAGWLAAQTPRFRAGISGVLVVPYRPPGGVGPDRPPRPSVLVGVPDRLGFEVPVVLAAAPAFRALREGAVSAGVLPRS